MGPTTTWFDRLTALRESRGWTVRELASELGTSGQTLYNWQNGTSRPQNLELVHRLAVLMGEEPHELAAELGLETGPAIGVLLRGLVARGLNAGFHRAHVDGVRALLGGLDAEEGMAFDDIDVVVAMLRAELRGKYVVSVLPQFRGRREQTLFHHVVHLAPPEGWPETIDDAHASQVRDEVDEILRPLLLPVSWEHSVELLPRPWRVAKTSLLVPKLLAARGPSWGELRYPPDANVLVTGVPYAGAPDVGALLADKLRFGFTTITNLAAMLGRGSTASLREDEHHRAQSQLALAVTDARSPVGSPFVWASNDVEPILEHYVLDQLRDRFPGVLVVLELEPPALDYAAWRCAYVATAPADPDPESVGWWRTRIGEQQSRLVSLAADRPDGDNSRRTTVHRLTLPSAVRPGTRDDGANYYDDVVEDMFDMYAGAADDIERWLLPPA